MTSFRHLTCPLLGMGYNDPDNCGDDCLITVLVSLLHARYAAIVSIPSCMLQTSLSQHSQATHDSVQGPCLKFIREHADYL